MIRKHDDNHFALPVDLHDDSSLDAALASVSGAVVTQLTLKAQAASYQARIDRSMAAAANRGASLDELAAAAGVAPDTVLVRLRATPGGLVEPMTRSRLRLDLNTTSSFQGQAARDGTGAGPRRPRG